MCVRVRICFARPYGRQAKRNTNLRGGKKGAKLADDERARSDLFRPEDAGVSQAMNDTASTRFAATYFFL